MAYILPLGANSSYRTYEEWKLPLFYFACPRSGGSYRTYEEWKLRDGLCVLCSY